MVFQAIMDSEATLALTTAGVSLTTGLLGIAIGFGSAHLQNRRKLEELFFKSLEFVKQGSQNRNVGISAAEIYWQHKSRRPLITGFMTGIAVYLLQESKQWDAAHEAFNLDRIMTMLLQQEPTDASKAHYKALLEAVRANRSESGKNQRRNKEDRRGIKVSDFKLGNWENDLTRFVPEMEISPSAGESQ
ncbi:hypothetical protein ACFPM3_06655 [Streptomyces coeruleoprunus]|uniref:Uncharacterized protein n=1 Tax=Streptomyces coeruleoprunus TaxID=285563 RepID=A0ABV9X9A0_9ACTN